MELVLTFDDSLIARYAARGSPPINGIWWKHGDECYPAGGWIDFGGTIVQWWSVAIQHLCAGASEEQLFFMDGPYVLNVQRHGTSLTLSAPGLAGTWDVPLHVLLEEVLGAARTICRKFQELGVAMDQQEGLGISSERLTRLRTVL